MEKAELIVKVCVSSFLYIPHFRILSSPSYYVIMSIHFFLSLNQVVMSPHEQAEEFVSSYRKLLREDTDVNNFQKILEMKVCSYEIVLLDWIR